MRLTVFQSVDIVGALSSNALHIFTLVTRWKPFNQLLDALFRICFSVIVECCLTILPAPAFSIELQTEYLPPFGTSRVCTATSKASNREGKKKAILTLISLLHICILRSMKGASLGIGQLRVKSFFVNWSLKQIIEVGSLWITKCPITNCQCPIANDQWPIYEATYAFMTKKEG